MTFDECISEWVAALNHEIQYLREQGGKKNRINEGRILRKSDGRYTYIFLLNSEITLPDSSPVRIEIGSRKIMGEVLSIEGFDLILDLNEYVSDYIEEADLYSEPWNILVELISRLRELPDSPNLKLSKRILSGKAENRIPQKKYNDLLTEIRYRSWYNSTTYIWGPPGTGKTYTLASITLTHLKKGRRILILSHSNAAVDGLMHRIFELKEEWVPGEIVRFGTSKLQEVSEHPNLLASRLVEFDNPDLEKKKKSLVSKQRDLRKKIREGKSNKEQQLNLAAIEDELRDLRGLIRDMEDGYVDRAKVLGVTLSRAIMKALIYKNNYDLVIIDEASMAYIPQIVFAASLANKNVVVCGDFKQLPPISLADHKLIKRWLKRDIFEETRISSIVDNGLEHTNLVMLHTQRRMHPKISAFSNKEFYYGKLNDHETVMQRKDIAKLDPFPNEALTLLDLSRIGAACIQESASSSRFNMLSALISTQLMGMAAKNDSISIGYISPYNAQARLVNAMIQELLKPSSSERTENKFLAATVHKFQGSERDMIFYDSVDSYPQPRASVLLTNPDSERLVNVAVTRARGKFIQLADVKYLTDRLSAKNPSKKLIEYARNNGESYSRYEIPQVLKRHKIENIDWFSENDEEHWFGAIDQVKNDILVSLPTINGVSKRFWSKMKTLNKSIRITIISPDVNQMNEYGWNLIPSNQIMPFMIIDHEILWYGAPFVVQREDTGARPPLLICRIKAPRVIKMFISFLGTMVPQQSRQEIAATTVSFRPSYTLSQFVTTWARCTLCNSSCKAETTSKGKIMLACSHCGKRSGISSGLLNKYLDHINLKCKKCNKTFEAHRSKSITYAECPKCEERIDIQSLWQ